MGNAWNKIVQNFREPYTALYDYDEFFAGEISMRKGDHLSLMNKMEDFAKVKNQKTNRIGNVPMNYIAPIKSLECGDWYFTNLSRSDAENLLYRTENQKGTFLIRVSETYKNSLTLSVKDCNMEKTKFCIHHYKISQNQHGYYFTSSNVHKTLDSLVTHNTNGVHRELAVRLTKPCYKTPPCVYRKWEINPKDIDLSRKLGSGNFGEVKLGYWRTYKMNVAVKILKQGSSDSEFRKETEIMKALRHPKLVQLYGVSTSDPMLMVQEYLPNGCLLDFLKKYKSTPFEVLIYFCSQIASGMLYLQNKNFVHRDLAARNVLVGENNIVKICDFGLSQILFYENVNNIDKCSLPLRWMAPEVVLYKEYNTKSDVWSYGMVLYEIFTYGERPFDNLSKDEIRENLITRTNFQMNLNKLKVNEQVKEIMYNCWKYEAIDRPAFEHIYYFFENYNNMGPAYSDL